MSTLLDTNVLIDLLRSKASAVEFVKGLAGAPSISVVTVMELTRGARSRREEAAIERMIAGLRLYSVDKGIAEAAGCVVKHYQPSHHLDDLDALIAATAEAHDLQLATLNVKHFPMFPRLKSPY